MFNKLKYRKYRYLVQRQILKNDVGEEYAAYGITVMSGKREIASIPDISTNYEDIRLLAESCTRNRLDPIHINDVIEDFLSEIPM